ncbi:hypothetical protein [Pectobacterium polaris]|uniref:hypothetical protein n=1 Tax=Pectobacterium polaris TaxID=2042057 RepID=UPI00240584E8|nr:hypothetical protein [Pectobacterium polaris]MDG0800060.1 hypothetical protein [Pectobacterium polaris]
MPKLINNKPKYIIFAIILLSTIAVGFLFTNKYSEIVSVVCTVVGAISSLVAGFSTERAFKSIEKEIEDQPSEYVKLIYRKRINYLRKKSLLSSTINILIIRLLVKVIEKIEIEKNESTQKHKSKKQTLTEIFLIKVKLNIFKAKLVTFMGMIIAFLLAIFMGFSNVPIFILLGYMIILECLERITAYRVHKGYFGANRYEALQLIQFISINQDDEDITGGGRQILKGIGTNTKEHGLKDAGEFAK